MSFDPDSANYLRIDSEMMDANALLRYLQHQPPEVLERVARSVSPQVKQIISHNVQGLLGVLPSEGFQVKVTTDRENLAGLLASAMLTGYFLRQMEQRMELEDQIFDSSMRSSDLD
ncbi:DUF760 domain-containing protein [Alkalinema sp. FACHB-956]|uniref:DUF760 domain-containing protein n=1 Tax=Alkalinema sp. FACHB-956 TaxID=2692768 RepID=UPI001687098C|nr:DUF760 domain-containing protein [Alkalinema sp. FACHB-956]MBD2329881.1 DUF760 domain-containing protein [Alkalinema sp. FACHB-956]